MSMYLKIALLLFCLVPATVQAIRVPGLYEVEVPVADKSEAARQQALQLAFRSVLVKLTGDSQAAGRAALAPLMKQAGAYLQQYRYREIMVENEGEDGETVKSPETRLWVKFDEDNLNAALRQLSVPVWGRERPSTLVWLAVADETGRHIVGPEEDADFTGIMERRARQRGIVLLQPLHDLDDSRRLRASDIWAGFREPVLDASGRYQADAILTGALESPVPGIWEARWTLYIDGKMASWTTESDLNQAVLDEGVDRLADILAAQFASIVDYGGVNLVQLSVADLNNVDQYAKVLAYLASLNSVTDVEVEEVEPGRVMFRLRAHGGNVAVNQAIELGRVLEPIGNREGDYRLLP